VNFLSFFIKVIHNFEVDYSQANSSHRCRWLYFHANLTYGAHFSIVIQSCVHHFATCSFCRAREFSTFYKNKERQPVVIELAGQREERII